MHIRKSREPVKTWPVLRNAAAAGLGWSQRTHTSKVPGEALLLVLGQHMEPQPLTLESACLGPPRLSDSKRPTLCPAPQTHNPTSHQQPAILGPCNLPTVAFPPFPAYIPWPTRVLGPKLVKPGAVSPPPAPAGVATGIPSTLPSDPLWGSHGSLTWSSPLPLRSLSTWGPNDVHAASLLQLPTLPPSHGLAS